LLYISLEGIRGEMGNVVGAHEKLLDRENHSMGIIVKLHDKKDLRYNPEAIKKLRKMVRELIICHKEDCKSA
jgi:hypothetical protein